MELVEFSSTMTKKQLEEVYSNATGTVYKAKRKSDAIDDIKRLNRARHYGATFGKWKGK